MTLYDFKCTDRYKPWTIHDGDQDGNDLIRGMGGNDWLDGSSGDNILIGGQGNDWLDGGAGRDTYIINRGDGRDTIIDTKGDGNFFRFGADIGSGDITLHLGSLMLDLGNGDAVHIGDFDQNDILNSASIGSFEFADGTVFSMEVANDASYGNSLERRAA